jgi:hypothetical protein
MKTEQRFWNWFIEHETELFSLRLHREVERERMFDKLASELRKVHPDLAFEFGPIGTTREFIISAGGIKRAFSSVAALVNSAPTLDRWQVTAFRPRRNPVNVVEFRGNRVDPKDVQFTLISNGKMAGVCLFIPGYREADSDIRQIGYLLLDEALGEYDVETSLGPIEMLSPETDTEEQRFPFAELPKQFDELVTTIGHGLEN